MILQNEIEKKTISNDCLVIEPTKHIALPYAYGFYYVQKLNSTKL